MELITDIYLKKIMPFLLQGELWKRLVCAWNLVDKEKANSELKNC